MTSSDNTQELKISENLGVLTANVLETEFLTDENDSNEAAEPSLEASHEDINCENRQILEAAFVSERSIDESSTSPQSSPIEAPSQVAGALASVGRDLSNVLNHATNSTENTNDEHLSTGVQPSVSTKACYAIEKRIPYIPSRMEAAFDPTGWLGITIADHVYCDFSSPNDFNKALEKLMRQIKNFETQLQSDSGK
ncbi:unnamed protein product [Rotaria magnacalcarata]